MSKASERAELAKRLGAMPFLWTPQGPGECPVTVYCLDDGQARFIPQHDPSEFDLSPENAVSLGRWLLDTFGEPTGGPDR